MDRNMTEFPLVSVIVPCFNYATYVADTLRSVLAQDYLNYELIIVDDGSSDDSAQVIEQVLAEEQSGTLARRTKFIRQSNAGVSAALNTGLVHTRGEYIATFDADDIMPAGRLALQVEYLMKHPEVGCLGGLAVRIDEQGALLPKKIKKRAVRRYDFAKALGSALVVGGNIAVYRRDAMDSV